MTAAAPLPNPLPLPADDAFKALADSKDKDVQAILADKAKMTSVLKYHVVPGAALNGARLVSMVNAAKGGVVPFTTLQGEKANVTLKDGSVAINGVPVKSVDMQGGKVIIHTIGEVLTPPTLAPKAAAGAAKAVEAAAKSSAVSLVAGAALALPLLAAALL